MSSHQPMGLALLFTRIEGSARLSSRLGSLYDSVLKKHHEIIQALLLPYKSKVIELTGDTSFVTFENPEHAVRAAVAFQQFISHHKWPNQEPVRIRLGLHWGHVPSAESHISNDLKLTMEICSVAHGEQILLSEAMVK